MKRPFFLAVLAVAALSLVACDGGEEGPSGGSGGTGGAGGTGGTGGNDGGSGGTDVVDCGIVDPNDPADTGWTPVLPPTYGTPLAGVTRDGSCATDNGWVSAIRGWVSAPGGAPLAGAKVQACITAADSIFSCLSPVDVNDEGVFTITMREDIRCLKKAALRVWKPGSGRVTFYTPIDISGEDSVVRLAEPIVLPWAKPATDLPPKGDEEAARPVVFDDGLVLDVTPSMYWSGTGRYECFAGRRIPTDAVGLLPSSRDFDGLYGFFPEGEMGIEGETSVGYPLTIPNTTGIPANATVELFILGGLECHLLDGSKVDEGYWAKFGEATVSADGATISSNPGQGLPCLNWFAYRLKG